MADSTYGANQGRETRRDAGIGLAGLVLAAAGTLAAAIGLLKQNPSQHIPPEHVKTLEGRIVSTNTGHC